MVITVFVGLEQCRFKFCNTGLLYAEIAFSNNQGSKVMLTALPDTENLLVNPGNVSQVNGTFLAGTDFTYSFPAYSISVLRIRQ